MERQTIQLLADGDAANGWVIRAPAVGVWRSIPADGSAVGGATAGILRQGNRHLHLRLPIGVRGVVRDSPRSRVRSLAVEWGETLFRLDPLGEAQAHAPVEAEEAAAAAGIFPAPTDGVFYSRPTPSSDPFVKPGDKLRRGQPVGLIEVMKTFNQILFEDDGLPDPAEVEEILVEDGSEVRAGDPLFRVR